MYYNRFDTKVIEFNERVFGKLHLTDFLTVAMFLARSKYIWRIIKIETH